MSLGQLVHETLRLPESDRADLAATLFGSLDAAEENDPAGWDAEIRGRIDELNSGAVRTVSWSEARRRIAGRDEVDA